MFTWITVSLALVSCLTSGKKEGDLLEAKYVENWDSLAQVNEEPDWFEDAKFGIYFHWGIYAVPAYGNEWYTRLMHFKGLGVYEHHLEAYGHPLEQHG